MEKQLHCAIDECNELIDAMTFKINLRINVKQETTHVSAYQSIFNNNDIFDNHLKVGN